MSRPVVILPEAGLSGLDCLDSLVGRGDVLCHESDAAAVEGRFPGCSLTTYPGGSLTPSRADLFALARGLDLSGEVLLVRDEERPWGWEAYLTAVGLMGADAVRLAGQSGMKRVTPPRKPDMAAARSLLLLVNGGIGNVVQTTPMLAAAHRHGLTVAFCPTFDGGGSLSHLFEDSLPGLVLLAPEEADGFDADIRINVEARDHLCAGELFHSTFREPMDRSEELANLQFFHNATGLDAVPEDAFIGCRNTPIPASLKGRVVLGPGSKPHWDSKRWPHFGELAARLDGPVILCRESDVAAHETMDFLEPLEGAGATLVTDATLAEAAAILHHARGVIANDCGLAHMAAAAGTPTIALFGPTSLAKNRPQRGNARCLSLCLDCQPCQGARTDPAICSARAATAAPSATGAWPN